MFSLHSFKMRHGGMALKIALAASWRLFLAAAPLNAAEQPIYIQQQAQTPLELAQKYQSLTQGGLFDPNRIGPFFEARHSAQSASEGLQEEESARGVVYDHTLW